MFHMIHMDTSNPAPPNIPLYTPCTHSLPSLRQVQLKRLLISLDPKWDRFSNVASGNGDDRLVTGVCGGGGVVLRGVSVLIAVVVVMRTHLVIYIHTIDLLLLYLRALNTTISYTDGYINISLLDNAYEYRLRIISLYRCA